MDAYVVGAMPPYADLLGGKVVTSLIASKEVADLFDQRYGDLPGTISRRRKAARLVLVTVTSALGRSSIYNRLKLRGPDLTEDKGRSETVVVEAQAFGRDDRLRALSDPGRPILTAQGGIERRRARVRRWAPVRQWSQLAYQGPEGWPEDNWAGT